MTAAAQRNSAHVAAFQRGLSESVTVRYLGMRLIAERVTLDGVAVFFARNGAQLSGAQEVPNE